MAAAISYQDGQKQTSATRCAGYQAFPDRIPLNTKLESCLQINCRVQSSCNHLQYIQYVPIHTCFSRPWLSSSGRCRFNDSLDINTSLVTSEFVYPMELLQWKKECHLEMLCKSKTLLWSGAWWSKCGKTCGDLKWRPDKNSYCFLPFFLFSVFPLPSSFFLFPFSFL